VVHLRENGFSVSEVSTDDPEGMAARYGVPPELRSCHLATVSGYLVTGHVPADVIWDLLTKKAAVLALAVPGMPIGSPGMEERGRPAERYNVLAFDARGRTSLYARR